MHAGDAAKEEDIPHFSEEEETMSQTGRPLTDEEMKELGLSPPQDDINDDVEDLEEVNVEESEEEEEESAGTAEQYFQKYGVMKPPPCPKQMPQMGGRMRPPEPPGPPPGRAAVEPKPAEPKPLEPKLTRQKPKPKPAEPKLAGQKPKPKPAEPPAAVPPPPPGPPPAGVTTVQWTKCTKTMAVLPPPPPPAAAHSSTSSSSRPCEAVVPYDEDDEYELGEEPDPQSTNTAMVKWKQQLGSYILGHAMALMSSMLLCSVSNDVIDTCQQVRQ